MYPNRSLLLWLLLILITSIGHSQIVINEFSAANFNESLDNYGEYEDWIELYNTGATEVDLSGYYLSDRLTNPTKWTIPTGVSIGPNDHLIIWASGRDGVFNGNPHANFKLTQTKNKEAVVLSDPAGVLIDSDSLNIANQINHSQGRLTDGSLEKGIFINPTPGAPNNNGNQYSERPVLAPVAGFYQNQVEISISISDPTIDIYYTTNGRTPTSSSTKYTGPFVIDQTSTISVVGIDQNLIPSHVEYHSYFINEFHTLPVVSISGRVDNLMGGNSGSRPHGKFELFDETGDRVAEVTGEFNKHGNDSWSYPQRGIDFISRDEFGDDHSIKYKIFPEYTDRDRFQRIILKAAANDNYPFENGAHIRDGYVHALAQRAGMELDVRTYEPCIMYVNGEYWGVYEMREKVDDHDYTEYYYDQEKEDIDFLKTWGGTWEEYGSQTDWNTLVNFATTNDLTIPANYAFVEERLNILSLIDYMILHAHIVSSDWLNWNTAWWRGRNPDGGAQKWRYVLWDEDATFGHYLNYTGVPSQSPLADPCNPEILDDPGGQGHIPMLNKLLENEDFFASYINRYADLNNTFFNCDYMIGMLDEFIGRIDPEMNRSINRWGGTYAGWETAVNNLRSFIQERCVIIDNSIVDCYEDEGLEGPYTLTVNVFPESSGNVRVNTAVGTNYPWTTTYFGGIDIDLFALPETDWSFDHWEVGNTIFAPHEFSEAINMSLGTNDVVTAFFNNICAGTTITPIISGAIAICPGSNTTLQVEGTFDQYFWSDGTESQFLVVDTPGEYSVVVSNQFGCTGSDTVTVDALNIPSPEIIGPLSFCAGGSTGLSVGNYASYLWSTNETTADINVSTPGLYQVTVTNSNNCSATAEAMVTVGNQLSPTISGVTSICPNSSTELSVDQYTSYIWSNTETTQTINVNTAGIYQVTVTDDNNCTGTSEISVTVSNELQPEISGVLNFCEGSSTEISVDNYDSYSWSTNEITQTISVTETGVYAVTVTDDNNCSGTDFIEVTASPLPTPEIDGATTFCADGSSELSVGPYDEYNWSTNETSSNITVSESGLYSVTVFNSLGCAGIANLEVLENTAVIPEISGSASFCPGSNTTLEVSGDFESYSWSTSESTSSIIVNDPGLYSVEVTDASGCTGLDQIEVTLSDELSPIINGDLAFCEGGETTLSAGNFSNYQWSNNQSSESIAVTAPGLYSVTVTDAGNCTGSSTVNVTTLNNPVPDIFGATNFCAGTSTELNVDNYTSINWSDNSTNTSIEVSIPGIYTVTVVDDNNCIGENFIAVTEDPNPTPEISGTASICTGSTTTLFAGSYESYTWSTNSIFQALTISDPGIYSVTVTDANGCNGSDQIEVTETDALIPNISGDTGFCFGDFTIIEAGTFDNYLWSTSQTTQSINVINPGNYSVTVSDGNGCTGTETITIDYYETPTPFITGPASLCANISSLLQAEIGYASYEWFDGSTDDFVIISGPGQYELTVTNAEGCSGSEFITISENFPVQTESAATICYGDTYNGTAYFESTTLSSSLTGSNGCDSTHLINLEVLSKVNINLVASINCSEGDVNISATANGSLGNFEFQWNTNDSGPDLEDLPAGTYTVTATDNFGCSAEQDITVDNYAPFLLDFEVEHLSCSGTSDGSINLNITGGQEPYTINWQHGATGEFLENLAAGDYILTIKDANGCSIFKSIEIADPGLINIDLNTTLANNGNNGTALAAITGGQAPYTYQWSNGGNGVFQENLAPGNYSVTATDANGCTSIEEFAIQMVSSTNNLLSNEQLNIFPNPNRGTFSINIEGIEIAQAEVKVYNVLGKFIYREKVRKLSNENIQIILGDISQGTYFLVIESELGRMIGELVVVN